MGCRPSLIELSVKLTMLFKHEPCELPNFAAGAFTFIYIGLFNVSLQPSRSVIISLTLKDPDIMYLWKTESRTFWPEEPSPKFQLKLPILAVLFCDFK